MSNNGTGYANAHQLGKLAQHLEDMGASARETGWHAERMVVSCGQGEEEIVVGIRWLTTTDEYAAEIR